MTMTGPLSSLTPQQLAQLAAAGFRPPAQAPAPALLSAVGQPEFGIGQGLAMLNAGLAASRSRRRRLPDFLTGWPGSLATGPWDDLSEGGN